MAIYRNIKYIDHGYYTIDCIDNIYIHIRTCALSSNVAITGVIIYLLQ